MHTVIGVRVLCLRICIYTYIRLYVRICIHIFTYIYAVCVYVLVCARMEKRACNELVLHLYVRIHMCIHASYMHNHAYTQIKHMIDTRIYA